MDYLRTLGSAAVSSLVQKTGLNLPFVLGAKVAVSEPSVWTLYEGTSREDGSPVSIFEYDLRDATKRSTVPLAKNALRKLRTVRHPDVLKFMAVVETEATICIMTERVRPLPNILKTWSMKEAKEKEEWLLWGLHRVTVALAFINESCTSTHGNVRPSSIFISPSGEWKLGGFELLSSATDEAAVLYTLGPAVPDAYMWASPEVKKGSWGSLKDLNVAAADAYALGLLLHAVFNPSLPWPATAQPPHPPPQSSTRGSIPMSIFPSFKKLLNPNHKARLTPKGFLEVGMAQTAGEGSGFFANNHLVKICSGLDNFSLASQLEKAELLSNLKESSSSFPPEFASYRVLPSLASALEYGGASAATILPLVLQLGKNVSLEDYPNVVLGPLIKLYTSSDRGTRMALLEHLPEYAEKLDKKAVVDKIWPHLQTGFSDTIPLIREATVKSIGFISSKLGDRVLNNDLLRHLARLQSDPEASIRTNTCVLLGMLGPSLGYNTKRKVLVPAFTKALKDPFVHARVAALAAFTATTDCFEIEELATKVIPNISFALLDKEKRVRDQAFKAIDIFVKKLEQHAETMPETDILETNGVSRGTSPVSPPAALATSTAGALAGWAMSSLGKLAPADLQSSLGTPPAGLDHLSSAPPPVVRSAAIAGIPHQSATSRTKAMQLGASKAPPGAFNAMLAEQIVEEEEAAVEGFSDAANPWGNDDLIDINADQDDWSTFETAPSSTPPRPLVEPQPRAAAGLGSSSPNVGHGSPLSTSGDYAWTDFNDAAPVIAYSRHPPKQSTHVKVLSPLSSTCTTPISSPALEANSHSRSSEKVSSPAPPASMAGMTKEEKAAEMTRRKEERKQRIAQLKEHKKNAPTAKS